MFAFYIVYFCVFTITVLHVHFLHCILASIPSFKLDGASLFYTSVKKNKNCSLLYKYLVHRIYGLPFNSPALVVDKESVFM